MQDDPRPDFTSVAVIGERTIDNGPFVDDHFLVLVQRSGVWFEYPMERLESMRAELEAAVGAKIVPRMANVTELASKVLHPPELEGRPLFEFTRARRGLGRLAYSVTHFGVEQMSFTLTEEVQRYLRELGTRA